MIMGNLDTALAALVTVRDTDTGWIADAPTEKKRGRKLGFKMPAKHSLGAAAVLPVDAATRARNHRKRESDARAENIAILDMETDPFDNTTEMKIRPFLAVLYSDKFETIVIWEENYDKFIHAVIRAIEALPGHFTIYAHNGGRFDFLFLIKGIRGSVSFKGRGIMSCRVGGHELRDSFHIIPERLANWQKDKFDYTTLSRKRRGDFKDNIIAYCIADCVYLLDIVKRFIAGFGLKLTIGQAAMHELKKHYDVEKFSDGWDGYIRDFFFGGRVECLRGRGEFKGAYKLYDVNSLYPHVMASYQHPVGGFWAYEIRYGDPGPNTVFIDLNCQNNGALVARNEDGETTAQIKSGRFKTTIWEYQVALKYNLISDVKINMCIDCALRSDFSKFVLPLYENRLRTKQALDDMKKAGLEGTPAWFDLKSEDMFYKLLLNNAYGKFAINPRNFKENYICDVNESPPAEWFKSMNKLPREERDKYELPVFEGTDYWIWQKPNPGFRFNNVGVAASVTGAARAILLEALQHSTWAIYCDTDSIICRVLAGVDISKTALGAWDLEDEFTRVIINGKKLYSTWYKSEKRRSAEQLADGADPRYTVKSKGASQVTWDEMQAILRGETVVKTNRGPTLNRYGEQYYVKRAIRATAPILESMQT